MANRIYKIYVPMRRTGVLYAVGLAIGLILPVAAGLYITITLLGLLTTNPRTDRMYLVLLAPLFGMLSGFLWVLGYEKFRNWLMLRRTALRSKRLRRLIRNKDAIRRLPHRNVEAELRRALQAPRRIKKILGEMPPGASILVLLPGANGPNAPPRAIPFEPVEIDTYDERVGWLIWRHWFDVPAGEDPTREATDQPETSSIRRFIEMLRGNFVILLIVASLGVGLWLQPLFYLGVVTSLSWCRHVPGAPALSLAPYDQSDVVHHSRRCAPSGRPILEQTEAIAHGHAGGFPAHSRSP